MKIMRKLFRPRLFVAVLAFASTALLLYSQSEDLAGNFRKPPASSRPQTLWFWMNSHVSRDGITRDLEALQRAGAGGVMMFDGGNYLPKGPADYAGPLWREMMNHAVKEAGRLGLQVGMHNGPGWSSSGGPWITPERSMQQLVWTETTVTGGNMVDMALAQPLTKEGYYRDAMVLAFPSPRGEETPYQSLLKAATNRAGAAVDIKALADSDRNSSVQIAAQDYLQLEFHEAFEARAITVFWGGGRAGALTLEASDDGTAYRRVCGINNPGRRGIEPPGVQSFPAVKARYFRLSSSGAVSLTEVALHHAPRIDDWIFKGNFTFHLSKQFDLPKEEHKEFAIDPASVRDISASMDRQGHLRWDAPAGSWTVVRLGQTATGQLNVSSSASGRGLECDKLSREAIEFHFQSVLAKVIADAGPLAGKTLTGVEVDSYETGMQNWTAAFPEEFRKRNGYSLTQYLPAMLGHIVGDARTSERFLYDIRRTQADMMADYYYGRLAELCRQHGLKLYIEPYGPGVFDELQVAGRADVPMNEFWERTPWTPNRVVKSVSSGAHTYGKPVVAGESFTGEEETARWQEYPYSLKTLGDLMFSLGLNQMFFHRYAHQPHPTAVPGMTMGPWGMHFDRTNTWFSQSSAWLGYLARAQFMLRQGTYAADVLYFVGDKTPDVAEYDMPILPDGYNYDLVNAEVLLSRVKVDNGRLVLPEGASYRLLMMPPDLKSMTPEVLHKLRDLVSQGATILGPKPEFSPTLRNFPESNAGVLKLAGEMWGASEATGHVYGKGKVFAAKSVGSLLQEMTVTPDFTYSSRNPDGVVVWLHRKLADGDVYFVANQQRRNEDVVCSFRVNGREPELWYPETGEMRKAAIYSTANGRMTVPIHFDPAESVFVVFRNAARPNAPVSLSKDRVKVLDTQAFPAAVNEAASIQNTFTISAWAKPDTNLRVMPREGVQGKVDETGKNYLVPAPEGDTLYGAGHAACGIAVGRNGVYVLERSTTASPAVLVARGPVSGWTHVAVTYRDGTPRLYLNGKFVREGQRSGKIVHPGVGAPPPAAETIYFFEGLDQMLRGAGLPPTPSHGIVYYFEGNMTKPELSREALSEEQIAALAAKGLPKPEGPPPAQLALRPDGKVKATLWESGNYSLGSGAPVHAEVAQPAGVQGPWQVAFQTGRGAPPSVTLPQLMSWHRHADPGVKYFSGTARYTHSLEVPAQSLGSGKRLYLDLGRVEVIAQVKINGKDLGILWKEPYRLDVTSAVHAGANTLEVQVTNLWANRLIGDEHLPAENQYHFGGHGIDQIPEWYTKGEPKPEGGRTTFATWQFYTKDEPLLESGLLGPVRLFHSVVLVLGN